MASEPLGRRAQLRSCATRANSAQFRQREVFAPLESACDRSDRQTLSFPERRVQGKHDMPSLASPERRPVATRLTRAQGISIFDKLPAVTP